MGKSNYQNPQIEVLLVNADSGFCASNESYYQDDNYEW